MKPDDQTISNNGGIESALADVKVASDNDGETISARLRANKLSALILGQFDREFYLRFNPDVEKSGIDPVDHYIDFGFHERRYPCAEWLLADIEAIERSGILHTDIESGGRDAETRLREFQDGIPPTSDFDTRFITNYYPRSLSPGENVFAFYCRHAHQPWCFANFDKGAEAFDRIRKASLFSAEYVRAQMDGTLQKLDPAAYYFTEGFRAGLNPSPNFNSRAYRAAYKDVAQAQADPMLHYLDDGLREGRSSKPPGPLTPNGGRSFKSDCMTILVCSHEASRTGAPLVGLNLAREYADQINVVSVLLRGGALEEDFRNLSQACFVVGDNYNAALPAIDELITQFRPSTAILNSVETTILLPSLLARDVPTISLVHEFAQYVHPFHVISRAAVLSDRVIFPSALVKSAALRELAQQGLDTVRPRNLIVRPQGLPILPPSKVRDSRLPPLLQRRGATSRPLIVGAGWVQPRKGVDLFIETARVLKHNLGVEADFLWVGGNYAPRNDLMVAAYLEDQIEASDLRDYIHFVEEQEDLGPILNAADAFFMSSRLDPYPNVALEAIATGVPVICFQRATGIADLATKWPDRVYAEPYNDTRRAAQTIAQLVKTARKERAVGLPLPADLERLISFSHYAEDIMRIIRGLVADGDTTKKLVQTLEAPGRMNSPLFLAELPPWLSSSPDLTASSSGLARLATRAALNGFPLARIAKDRIAFLSESQSADELAKAWSEDDGLVAPQVSPRSSAPFSAILISENIDVVRRLCALAMLFPRIHKLVLVSTTIATADVRPIVPVDLVIYPRKLQTAVELQYLLGSAPAMVFDDLPADGNQRDWQSVFWASACAADVESLTLLGQRGVELKPQLDAKSKIEKIDPRLHRRMIEPWTLGGFVGGKAMQALLRIMMIGEKAELWSSFLSAQAEAPSTIKIVHRQSQMDGRDYDLLVGRVPILVSSTTKLAACSSDHEPQTAFAI